MNETEKIKDFISKNKYTTNVTKYLTSNSDVDIFISNILSQYPWFKTKRNVMSFVAKDIYQPVTCLSCGKVLKLDNAREGKKFCSTKCSNNYESKKEKGKQTCLNHLGVVYPSQNKQVKAKFKKTCLDRYGVDYPMQSKNIMDKSQKTIQRKYGTLSYSQTDEFKEKVKKTSRLHFGTDYPLQNVQIKSKILEKCFDKYYEYIITHWQNYVIPLFTKDEYNGKKESYCWKCVKCGNDFTSHIYTTAFTGIDRYMPRCPICYPYISGYSHLEKEVVNFVKSIYQGEIIENDRKTIKPLELDIVIPKKKLAIEFDGNFYHAESQGKDKTYHLNKTESCEAKGYQLIHIFEYEWIEQQNIVKDRIKSLLGIYNKRIYARKCEIKNIDNQTKKDFLNINHLQGNDNSKYHLGLYYGNELVSVMTFGKPRFNKKYDFELIRFASKLGTQVIGGFSKLLKYFEKEYQGKSIISYADRRYSKGNLYKHLNFECKDVSDVSYIWVNKNSRFSRYQCQKHKLKQILGEKFNPNLSESENMMMNGYNKIYDCGNLIFVLENKR